MVGVDGPWLSEKQSLLAASARLAVRSAIPKTRATPTITTVTMVFFGMAKIVIAIG
jgi:hypothetical protein